MVPKHFSLEFNDPLWALRIGLDELVHDLADQRGVTRRLAKHGVAKDVLGTGTLLHLVHQGRCEKLLAGVGQEEVLAEARVQSKNALVDPAQGRGQLANKLIGEPLDLSIAREPAVSHVDQLFNALGNLLLLGCDEVPGPVGTWDAQPCKHGARHGGLNRSAIQGFTLHPRDLHGVPHIDHRVGKLLDGLGARVRGKLTAGHPLGKVVDGTLKLVD